MKALGIIVLTFVVMFAFISTAKAEEEVPDKFVAEDQVSSAFIGVLEHNDGIRNMSVKSKVRIILDQISGGDTGGGA